MQLLLPILVALAAGISHFAAADKPPVVLCTDSNCTNCPVALASLGPGSRQCQSYNLRNILSGQGFTHMEEKGNPYKIYARVEDPGDQCKVMFKTTTDAMITGCGVMTKFFDSLSSSCSRIQVKETFKLEKCCGWGGCSAAGVPGAPYKLHPEEDALPCDMFEFLPNKSRPEYLKYADGPSVMSGELAWPIKTNTRKWEAHEWSNTTGSRISFSIDTAFTADHSGERRVGETRTNIEEYEFFSRDDEQFSWAAWTPYLGCTEGTASCPDGDVPYTWCRPYRTAEHRVAGIFHEIGRG